jgi:hypothetical protein
VNDDESAFIQNELSLCQINLRIDEGVWMWHGNAFGRILYAWVLANRLVYEFKISTSEKYVRVVPKMTLPFTNMFLPHS